ncbi:hypothetical protein Sjap_003085 [Stephania japonica]|uniref:Uncharacterized protein n=1 Tax=Stephania japonica TaxID=461633 RepID=A0AAP0PUR0_9MAGN
MGDLWEVLPIRWYRFEKLQYLSPVSFELATAGAVDAALVYGEPAAPAARLAPLCTKALPGPALCLQGQPPCASGVPPIGKPHTIHGPCPGFLEPCTTEPGGLPGGHPSWYYSRSGTLNYGVRWDPCLRAEPARWYRFENQVLIPGSVRTSAKDHAGHVDGVLVHRPCCASSVPGLAITKKQHM